jgi:hypothetical protein
MKRDARRASRALAVASAVLATFLLHATADSKPFFAGSEDSLAGLFHRMAFAPTVASYAADSTRDSVRITFESLISDRLRAAGFEVVDPATGGAIGRRLVDSLGGLFDPRTGAVDTARAELVRARVIAALHAEHGADGMIYWRIVQVGAAFSGSTAEWDEVKEKIEQKSFLGKLAGPSYRGTVPAYSFMVVIDDPAGRSRYMHRVGIAVGATISKGKFVDRPVTEALGDPARNAAAVEKALAPFCKAVTREPRAEGPGRSSLQRVPAAP